MSSVALRTQKVRFALLAALLMLPAGLLAQSGAGSIQGTVQDASSAAIPGCSVHIANQATGVTNDTTSNASGFYAVPGLFAGNYTITFSAAGMKKYQTNVSLLDAQVAVLNPKMTVGEVTEQVTVSSESVQLATYDSATVSTQLDSSRIDQLPQNGRNVLGLAQNTVPGVESGGTRANGLMQEGMEYSQDGAPMTNRNFGGEANAAQATLPDPDSVQEAKFETLNSSSQFATPATVIITTKSGTNVIHVSLSETARNNYFGIAKARQNPANFAAPHLVRKVGGPVGVRSKPQTLQICATNRFFLPRALLAQSANAVDSGDENGDFSGTNGAGPQQFQRLINSSRMHKLQRAHCSQQSDPAQSHRNSSAAAGCRLLPANCRQTMIIPTSTP